MVRTLSPSGVKVDSNRLILFPGNITVRLPSIDQNIVGCGFPVDLHSNETSEGVSIVCGVGRIVKSGGAIIYFKIYFLNHIWLVKKHLQ